jgi:N-acetylneuraminic acid mutarotase
MRNRLMFLIVFSLDGALASCGGSSNSSGAPTLQSIRVTPTPFSTGIGIARQLTAAGTYSDSSTALITLSVKWQTLDNSVATVADGVVTGVALGSTTVSASFGTVSTNLPIKITANAWSPCANMENGLVSAAALLQTGKVLVVGVSENSTTPAAELYDPSVDAWSPTGPMIVPIRASPASTLLADGRMLIAGGGALAGGGYVFPSAEIYDPSTNSWSATPDMPSEGAFIDKNASVLLPNGQVLIAGGASADQVDYSNTAVLYDPMANAWTTAASMSEARFNFTLTLLQNGKVLAAGGMTPISQGSPAPPGTFMPEPTASAEIYDPSAGTWAPVAAMNLPRAHHIASLLSNGDVLVISGDSSSSAAEIYDPNTNTWTQVGNLEIPRTAFTATLLPSGKIIVAGGGVGSKVLSETELFDPVTGTWSPAASMESAREGHVAALLQNSTLLVAGGVGSPPVGASCELYW